MLLEREPLPISALTERLVNLQEQLSSAPYVGLWGDCMLVLSNFSANSQHNNFG